VSPKPRPVYVGDLKALKKRGKLRILIPANIGGVFYLPRAGWPVEAPKGTMFLWAPIPERYKELGSLEFSTLLLKEALTAVSPGLGFGPMGEGFVRFALIENEHRTRQAMRCIKQFLRS
jgi:alanine-synthesizing transaminase